MDNFKFVEAIEAYCTANDIIFVYGASELQEVHMGQSVILQDALLPNQLVLLAGFNDQPQLVNGATVGVSYAGFMALGRHCEANTSSSLDETTKQKYDRRLGALKQRLANVITDIACANELIIGPNLDFQELTNQFSYNLDLIQTNITFSH